MDLAVFAAALRSHAGHAVEDGLRLTMPCAHASWQPTRRSGQTTGSMIARLAVDGPTSWLTGTSSPCLSVLKPVLLGLGGPLDLGPPPRVEGADGESLFWRHERLHRATLERWTERTQAFEAERAALEAKLEAERTAHVAACLAPEQRAAWVAASWAEHRAQLTGWLVQARAVPSPGGWSPHLAWWARQSARDGL